jgi:hypothetical protein
MQHIGQLQVCDLLQRAEHFARHVTARIRLPDDLEFFRLFQRRLNLDCELLCFAFPLDGRVELSAADELGIGNALFRIGNGMHHAVRHRQIGNGDAQILAGHFNQQTTRLGRRTGA